MLVKKFAAPPLATTNGSRKMRMGCDSKGEDDEVVRQPLPTIKTTKLQLETGVEQPNCLTERPNRRGDRATKSLRRPMFIRLLIADSPGTSLVHRDPTLRPRQCHDSDLSSYDDDRGATLSLSESNELVFSKSTKVWEQVATLDIGTVTPVGHELTEKTLPTKSVGDAQAKRDERESDATGHLARR